MAKDLWNDFDIWLDENYDRLDKEFVEMYGDDNPDQSFGLFAALKHEEFCKFPNK